MLARLTPVLTMTKTDAVIHECCDSLSKKRGDTFGATLFCIISS